MRATVSSRGLVTGLVALLLTQAGCTTSSEYVRGERLRESSLGEKHTDTLRTNVDPSYVGSVVVERNTCTEVSTEFSRKRIDTKEGPPMGSLILGVAMLGGGLVLMSQSGGSSDEEEDDGLSSALGIGLSAAAIYPLVTALTDKDVRQVEVVTGEVEDVRTERCEDRSFTLKAPLQWSVVMGSAQRKGRTGSDGTVALSSLLNEMVAESVTEESSIRQLVAGRGIGFRLEFERTPAATFRLDSKALPDGYFRRFADQYRQGLEGDARARFENCELIGKSARESLECYWSQ
ncbi:hypothetical protein [Corallococcus sp. AS-1-6]|uniref:hypothetical protein n=1 Tax=Corallococcus sp. AS-1-6 TaxID=2874599 RepID=UPI001CBC9424|nr:hypothetical protein [Corallococcus sp. AS-1-6]